MDALGGQHLCPGRHLAKNIQLATLAVFLSKYETELIDPVGSEQLMPSVRNEAYGKMEPLGKIPLRIRKRRLPTHLLGSPRGPDQ